MDDIIKILYIDDYDLDRELVRDALEKESSGFTVTEASNREDFETLLKTKDFDVVLSDFNIAGFEGLQVLDAVRAHDPRLPVIIVTGTGSEEIAVKSLKQGASDYVIKRPQHIRKLSQTISAVLETKALKDRHEEAQSALRESEEQYRAILENILVGIYQVTFEGKILFANRKMVEIFGYDSCEELESIGNIANLYARPQERLKIVDEILDKGFIIGEYEFKRKDGRSILVRIHSRLTRNREGALIFEGLMEDVTEYNKLEEQFRHAQKMEAIGTLAGGIAHDFNNIMTTIIGNTGLALAETDKNSTMHEIITEIKTAGERASDLTRQLLAFSRRQIIQPRILDLNELLMGMEKMLSRLLKKNIELSRIPGPELWPVETDPGQIEQVVMNLIINARDAMPGGGKLTVETVNVYLDEDYFRKHGVDTFQSGPFVMLAVTDSGIGMDRETQEHIFDPFFTTKGTGEGTGLGLSTVYGIVKQNRGFVWVYSELGKGSVFKVYLPRAREGVGAVDVDAEKKITVDDPRSSETILIVEDDDALRKLVHAALEKRGYEVLEAEDGENALNVSKAYDGAIDLVITDVVMPNMGGRELVNHLQPRYPQMKVLYMSGYTSNGAVRTGMLVSEINFLEKPFTAESLVRKVREVLKTE